MDNQNHIGVGPRLITLAEVKKLVGLSNTHLIRLEEENLFPRRLYLTPHRVVYYAHEIEKWIEARAAERAHRKYGKY